MSRLGSLAVAALLCGCAAPAAVTPSAAVSQPAALASSVALRNADFEADMEPERRCAAGWDCIVHNNPAAFRFFPGESAAPSGGRSLCVERVADEPWALVRQLLRAEVLRGARLRLSLAVRVVGTTGEGAGPWLLIETPQPVHEQRLVNQAAGWERIAVDITVPMDATEILIGATLLGPGRACFDDARLEILQPPKIPV